MSRQKRGFPSSKSYLIKVFIIFLGLSGPSCFKKPCDRALSQAKQKELSLKQKQKLFKKALFCLSQAEDSDKALLILERLLKKALQEKDFQQAKNIEKSLAKHYFYVLQDYHKAIKYYTQLLKRPLKGDEAFVFRYQIADSFFQLKKPEQALLELEKSLVKGLSLKQQNRAFFLKLSVLIFQKKLTLAEQILKDKLKQSPAQQADLLREYLALVYESQKEFLKAIEELKKIKKPSRFVEQKIKRLMERQSNQPGF